ncbi:Hvo_1808 family surface protein [Halocatena marina]|uniref:Hvo_1808 family surface protein n=1 Tax=Halocatena marina TaxID=2934937 RepID=UPI00200F3CDC|nr:Hvo_1808 family surface protein [Halocatena marina]
MRARHVAVVALLIGLVVLALPVETGLFTVADDHATSVDSIETSGSLESNAMQSAPPDPNTDTLGWESGYWYNESITVDQSDGLSESELDAFLARSMARVEHIRRLEFTEQVEIEFVRPENLDPPRNDTFGLTSNEQLWEALFFYGESTNASRAIQRAQQGGVLGFAAEEGSDRIVIVGDPSKPTVDGATMIHELAHMLQDQQFDLQQQRYRHSTLDGEFAKDGLVEGEAAYITERYRQNCQDGWNCIDNPTSGNNADRTATFRFYRFTYFPYAAGEVYVRTLFGNGGWTAINDAHTQLPTSTATVIHPGRPDEPSNQSFTDRSRNGWNRIENDTVGEAGIYTLFWRQSASDSPIREENLSRSDSSADVYNYVSRPSSGWRSDGLYTYAKGDKRGYVWKTSWDSERDAREFRNAYIEILETEGATKQGVHTWRINNGAFADAFSVRRTGTTVTIVNGPTIDALDDIDSKADATTEEQSTHTTNTEDTTTTTTTSGPGFGGLIAIAGIVLLSVMLQPRQ